MVNMFKKDYFILAFFICLTVTLTGCNENEISESVAKKIALQDAPNFKPNNTNFEVSEAVRKEKTYRDTEQKYDSWVIIISSKEPLNNIPARNIIYQIDVNSGEIIDRANYMDQI